MAEWVDEEDDGGGWVNEGDGGFWVYDEEPLIGGCLGDLGCGSSKLFGQ